MITNQPQPQLAAATAMMNPQQQLLLMQANALRQAPQQVFNPQ